MYRTKTLLTVYLLLIMLWAAAQDKQADSLKHVIATQKADTSKVNNLLALSKLTGPEAAINYSQQARELATQLNFPSGLAAALKSIGLVHYNQGNYKEALVYWNQALRAFEAINDEVGVSNMLSNLGAVYFNQSDDAGALDHYLKSLKVAEKLGNKLRIATALTNIGAVYFNKPATHDKALEYYLRALPLSRELNDKEAIGTITVNLGEIYMDKGEDDTALAYFKESLQAVDNTELAPYTLNDIGKLYRKKGDYATAIKYHRKANAMAEKYDSKLDISQSLIGIGNTYLQQGNTKLALAAFQQAQPIVKDIKANYELKKIYTGLATAYSNIADYQKAFQYQSLLTNINDTLYNTETDKRLANLLFDFELQKKQGQIDLLTKDKALQDLDLKRQRVVKNSLMLVLVFIGVIAFILFKSYRTKVKTNQLLDRQKAEIERLLLNVLPAEVAKELQRSGQATSKYYENVSVMFTDFKNFTKIADTYAPQELVAELNEYFIAFDNIIEKYNLEKIKTIGDSYMCAGGIHTNTEQHPYHMVKASIEIQEQIRIRNEKRKKAGLPVWDLRIGIHSGPVVAGVVGRKKYAYDIWGSTVNIASRMESNGEPGKVNISATTYELVKDKFNCSYRGQIFAKNVGDIDMYFVEHEIPQTINKEILVS